ncbi:MAG: efflux transporter outer membrane subunit [Pseudomonadota bacterium]
MPTDARPTCSAPRPAARPAAWVALGAVWLTLGACSTLAPQRAAPIEVPAAWSADAGGASAQATSLAQWWQRFDDPLLGRLVTQALQANTSVQSAAAALRQARALRDVSAAGLLPSVDGSGSAQRSKSGDNSASSSFRAGLDASWELDVFGANRSALQGSEAGVRASAADLGDVQVSIAAEVALAYIGLRYNQARLAIANDNLASQQEALQLTQWRLQAGLVTSLEAEQARGAVEQTRAQLPALQTSIAQSTHALAVLTGQAPAALQAILASAAPLPQVSADLALSLPAETLRQRPDVRAAEHQVSAAAARVAQADAARKPSFRLSGSLGLNALTLGSLTSGAAFAAALLAGVSLPIFDGGAGAAQVQAQQAAFDQAQLAYKATVLTALKDVEDALVALRGDRERVARLQQAAEASANAALLARQRYSSGLIDFQTVLETQRSQLSSQDSLAGARADVSADHVRLYKALGGGWLPDAPVLAAAADSLPTATTPRRP